MYYDLCNSSSKHVDLVPSEDGHNWPKHVKAINIYKLNHTGWCYQLFHNLVY
jgi:hypothetical protein